MHRLSLPNQNCHPGGCFMSGSLTHCHWLPSSLENLISPYMLLHNMTPWTMICSNDCSCPFSPTIPRVWEELLLYFHKTNILPSFRPFLAKSLFCKTTKLTNHNAHHYHFLLPYFLFYPTWVPSLGLESFGGWRPSLTCALLHSVQ